MEDLPKRCEIHAAKMQGEGFYTTANTLQMAADRIRKLEIGMEAVRAHLRIMGGVIGLDEERLRSAEGEEPNAAPEKD